MIKKITISILIKFRIKKSRYPLLFMVKKLRYPLFKFTIKKSRYTLIHVLLNIVLRNNNLLKSSRFKVEMTQFEDLGKFNFT